jgi:hypothetical protein
MSRHADRNDIAAAPRRILQCLLSSTEQIRAGKKCEHFSIAYYESGFRLKKRETTSQLSQRMGGGVPAFLRTFLREAACRSNAHQENRHNNNP